MTPTPTENPIPARAGRPSPLFSAPSLFALVLSALALAPRAAGAARAEEGGCVATNIRMLGLANDKVCIDSFRDPHVDGVVCHVSRARTGGVKGAIGVAEDTSDASIACRQVGPITIKGELKDGEDVFRENRSWLFKKLQVVRFYDRPNNTLVYLSYSDKLIDGSPKNAISTVPIMPWGGK
ncbi:MAG: CreA family protein [Telmatospirillum sp.]|nr:CreA family protein [Telmatospirillum sp.]